MNDVSICVTNFGRPHFLQRAIDSAITAGFRKISISSMKHPTESVEAVLQGCESRKDIEFHIARNIEMGCNESWVQAAYRASSPFLILIHDDDSIAQRLGGVVDSTVLPKLKSGEAGFASWRAVLRFNDNSTRPTEYMRRPTGVWDSADLEAFVMRPNKLSLSPIISVFNRETLIHALKEADHALTDYLHPSMTLGTEILAYLRHCSTHPKWLFVDEQLSQYGAHAGSGTCQYEKANNISRLSRGYDQARNYYSAHRTPPTSYEPRILLLSVPFESQDESERARFANARRTWDFHFNQGTMLDFPIKEGAVSRSSRDIGDTAWVPFLKDIFDYGCKYAMPEDILAYVNCDIGLSTVFPEKVIQKVQECGVAMIWRRTLPFSADVPLRTCKNGNRDGGVDVICVSPAWWKEHRDAFPDMLIAANHFDFCARVYAERATNGQCYMDDHAMHAPHDSFFSRHKMDNVRQKHNHAAARQFFHSIGDHKIVQIIDKGQLKG